MKLFQGKSRGFTLAALSAAFSLLAALVYLIYTLAVNLFVPSVFVVTLLGTVGFALVALTKWDFALLVPTILAGLGFGLHLYDRVEMFAYMATGIYGMGERGAILWVVLLIMALQLAAIVLGCISCFSWRTKEQEDAAKAAAAGQPKRSKVVPVVATVAVVAVLAIAVTAVVLNGGGPSGGEVTLTGIEVTTPPAKTEYSIEDFFSADGMVVSAVYSDGTTAPITGYEFGPTEALTEADTQAVVTYMGFEATVPISVHEIVVVELSGGGVTAKLMEHGVAYIEASSGKKTGTWSNAGKNISVTLDGTKYDATESGGTYTLNLEVDGTPCTLSGSVAGELLLGGTFTGTSVVGEVSVTLNEDGTLSGLFAMPLRGTWERQGMKLLLSIIGMDGTATEYSASKVEGVYTTIITMNLGGYMLSATCSFAPIA